MPKCPKCKHQLDQYPPVCKDDPVGNTPCQCDDRWFCTICKTFWYEGCTGHHYGDLELESEIWH